MTDVSHDEARSWLGSAAEKLESLKTRAALADACRSAALDPGAADALYLLGLIHWRLDDAAACKGALRRSVTIDRGLSVGWRDLGRWFVDDPDAPGLAHSYLKRALAIDPADASSLYHLGLAQSAAGDLSAAERVMARAVVIAPRWDVPRSDLAGLKARRQSKRAPRRVSPWPRKRLLADLEKVVNDHIVLPHAPPEKIGTRDSHIVTFGSCFATHVSTSIAQHGYASHHMRFNEDANSTFSNRLVLDWISGVDSAVTEPVAQAFGADARGVAREAITRSAIAVMTLGVAAAFFTPAGDFVFAGGGSLHLGAHATDARFRMSSVAENADNIRHIIATIRRLNPGIKLVFTVSPVPLAGVVDMGSAVVADCLSKSTLRVSISEVLSSGEHPGEYYFPAFEIVKWLGSHLDTALFGTDDQDSRHVDDWVVDLVVGAFLRHYLD